MRSNPLEHNGTMGFRVSIGGEQTSINPQASQGQILLYRCAKHRSGAPTGARKLDVVDVVLHLLVGHHPILVQAEVVPVVERHVGGSLDSERLDLLLLRGALLLFDDGSAVLALDLDDGLGLRRTLSW